MYNNILAVRVFKVYYYDITIGDNGWCYILYSYIKFARGILIYKLSINVEWVYKT